MRDHVLSAHLARAALLLALVAVPAQAQLQDMPTPPRIQIAAFGGYQWGGSLGTDGLGGIPAGELKLTEAAGWGGIVSFLTQEYTAVELWYLRQDNDLAFQRYSGGTAEVGGFATNYLQIGGRQEFPTGSAFHPFISGSAGITVFDYKAAGVGTQTRFSFSMGAGFQYMGGQAQRFGVRADARWWVTPVPSDDYGVWCDYWGFCYVAQGWEWINQGQISAGFVVAF